MTTSMNDHPTDAELRAWLDESDLLEDQSPTTSHVYLCDRCAGIIERLSDETPEPAGTDDRIKTALVEAVAPPPDLANRLRARLRERERTQDELNTVLRLFGLPGAVMKAMSTDPHEDDAR